MSGAVDLRHIVERSRDIDVLRGSDILLEYRGVATPILRHIVNSYLPENAGRFLRRRGTIWRQKGFANRTDKRNNEKVDK